ncbi:MULTISPECIES: SCO4848 family membrane protein [unclassified Embleya]|uniref:SCO4848 family membrane protein n=1 Tax=unclassified Embleya TaxID=2699296 RepID=UPI0036E7D7CB
MRIGRGISTCLVLFGVWSWILWPNFLKNIWADDRSWNDGATTFFLIHLALTIVSFVAGNAIGWLGIKGLRAARTPQP